MRTSGVVAIGLVWGMVSGCHEDARTAADKQLDTKLVPTLNNIGVENAILAQHTLYPYHFVLDGAELNELGQRDFAVLARHFVEHPGLLNIRQGEGIAPELYKARVAYVTSRLKEAGVEPRTCERVGRHARRARPAVREGGDHSPRTAEMLDRPSAKPAPGRTPTVLKGHRSMTTLRFAQSLSVFSCSPCAAARSRQQSAAFDGSHAAQGAARARDVVGPAAHSQDALLHGGDSRHSGQGRGV